MEVFNTEDEIMNKKKEYMKNYYQSHKKQSIKKVIIKIYKSKCSICNAGFNPRNNAKCCSLQCKKKYTIQLNTKRCKLCNVEFLSSNKQQQYCSLGCGSIAVANEKVIKSIAKHAHRCKQCSKEFKHKSNSNNIFCSRECAFKHKTNNKKNVEDLLQNIKSSKFYINTCEECSISFTSNRKANICASDDCKRKQARKKARINFIQADRELKKCLVCGKEHMMKSVEKTCSKECKMDYKRVARKNARNIGKIEKDNHRKRARRFNVGYESGITIQKLIARDGNKCLECGVKILSNNIAGYHKNNATIGHLVPLSKGGSHTWSNIQLECMQCNTNIGAVTHGQLRIAI